MGIQFFKARFLQDYFCTFKSKSDSRHLFQIKLKRDFTLATADVTINLHTKIQDALKHVLRVLHGREVPLSANMHFRDFFSGIYNPPPE